MSVDPFARMLDGGAAAVSTHDASLYRLVLREQRRQAETLSLVASSSVVDPAVLALQAVSAVNITAEGYPGRRYHAGCVVLDEIEQLAIDRARALFGAQYANVQPHSASSANYAVLAALLRPGEVLLGMALEYGGHLTHGNRAGFAGQYFTSVTYGLTGSGGIDFDQVRRLALTHRPRVIVCGATAYPRTIDFARFRAIADEVGAYLVADISHTAGLVAAGLHPSPIKHAHITTTCTHKQLGGPRGGLIMCGPDAFAAPPRGGGTLAEFLDRAVFPFMQGAPAMNVIAAKAHALARAGGAEFREWAGRIVLTAGALATALSDLGYRIVTAGTDNHIVLVDFGPDGRTGLAVQEALESCAIIVNKNRVPGDQRSAKVTSGVRLGSNTIAWRGMGEAEARRCADLIDRVVRGLDGDGVDAAVAREVRRSVRQLCEQFPLAGYPAPVSVAAQAVPSLV